MEEGKGGECFGDWNALNAEQKTSMFANVENPCKSK